MIAKLSNNMQYVVFIFVIIAAMRRRSSIPNSDLLFFQIAARYRPQRFFDIAVRQGVLIVNVFLP